MGCISGGVGRGGLVRGSFYGEFPTDREGHVEFSVSVAVAAAGWKNLTLVFVVALLILGILLGIKSSFFHNPVGSCLRYYGFY